MIIVGDDVRDIRQQEGEKRGGYSDVATWFVDRLPLHPDTTQISDPTACILNSTHILRI